MGFLASHVSGQGVEDQQALVLTDVRGHVAHDVFAVEGKVLPGGVMLGTLARRRCPIFQASY